MAKKGRQNKVSKEVANPNVSGTEFNPEYDTEFAAEFAEAAKKSKKKSK